MKKETLVKNEQWSYSRLKNIPTYNRNRDVMRRVEKTSKILKNFLPTHLEMSVGIAVKPFGIYKKGDKFLLNGNTRMAVYEKYPELIPPHPFNVTIYNCHDEDTTFSLYESMDSKDSVETSTDKMTGLLRESNFNPISKVLKLGKFKTALNIAARYGNDENGIYLQNATDKEKFEYFIKELIFLDKKNLDNFGKRYSGNLLAALLMVLKKYGTNHPRISLMINNMQEGIGGVNEHGESDGVNYVYNKLYTDYKDTWNNTSFTNFNKITSHILYCLDKFINNEPITKEDRKKINGNKLLEFFQFYNERVKK